MFSNEFGAHSNVECGLVYFLFGKPAPIPLVSVDTAASVIHAVARINLTQVYVNKEAEPIEAIYYFPIDSNGGVTYFHAELEGRTIKVCIINKEIIISIFIVFLMRIQLCVISGCCQTDGGGQSPI